MLNVVLPCVIMLNVIMLNVVLPCVIVLSVVMLNVIMLSVVAPIFSGSVFTKLSYESSFNSKI
jgi:hypothetical protein